MPLGRHGRDVLVAALVSLAVVVIGWLSLLMVHQASDFNVEVKMWFHIP